MDFEVLDFFSFSLILTAIMHDFDSNLALLVHHKIIVALNKIKLLCK